jgi:ABC-type enterochelin transport system substrate-binding protein
LIDYLKNLEQQLEQAHSNLETIKEREEEAKKQCAKIESQMKNFKNDRETQLKQVEVLL